MSAFFSHSRRKSWFRIVFYSILEPWAHLETVFFYTFSVFFAHFMSWSAWACICCMSAFSSHWRRNSWFRIVFYGIFEPWAPLEKVSFLDFFSCEFHVSVSMRLPLDAWVLFRVIQDETIDFVLFFTAFLSRVHLCNRSLFYTFCIFWQIICLD